MSKTPEQFGKEYARPGRTAEQLRAACDRDGVDYEQALAHREETLQRKAEIVSQRGAPAVANSGPKTPYLHELYEVERSDPALGADGEGGSGDIRGGQGTVRFGCRRADHARVAFKHLPKPNGKPSLTYDPKELEEVRVLRDLTRTTEALRWNLIEYLDVGFWDTADEQAEMFCVVMPAADTTLDRLQTDLERRGRPLSAAASRRLVAILARVMHDLHGPDEADGGRQVVLHRDLKPQNILLYKVTSDAVRPPEGVLWDADGTTYRPVVTDLGLAKVLPVGRSAATATSAGMGTKHYMAPEQVTGGRVDRRTDVYGLGGILYTCLAGVPPFRGSTEHSFATDVLSKHHGGLPPHPDAERKALKSVVDKCLRKLPFTRYRSAGHLGQALSSIASGGRPTDWFDPLLGNIDWAYRNKWKLIRAALVLIAVITVAVITVQDQIGRTTQQAKLQLLIDAAGARQREGDDAQAAVLIGLALKDGAGINPDQELALRRAASQIRSRLFPLRNVLDVSGQCRGCDVSPDGRFAAVASDQAKVWLVNLSDGELARPDPYQTGPFSDENTANSASGVAFHPTLPQFAVATNGGRVHVVSTADQNRVGEVEFPGLPLSVHYSRDGKYLAVAGRPGTDPKKHPNPSGLVVYDAFSYRTVKVFPVRYELYTAAFSPDGNWLAAAGGVAPDQRLVVWKWAAAGEPPAYRPLQQPARVFSLAFRPGAGAKLVTGDVNGAVRFWDLEREGNEWDGPELVHDKQVRVTAFGQDGRTLLVGGEDGTARLWDVDARMPIGQRFYLAGEARAGAVHVTAGRVVTADFAGHIRVWDFPVNTTVRVVRHPSPVWDAVFDTDGGRVLTSYASSLEAGRKDAPGGARVWPVDGRWSQELRHGADVMVARFRPHDPAHVVTCGNDGLVRVWQVDDKSAREVNKPLVYNDGKVIHAADFDPTGGRFAVGGYAGAGQSEAVVQEYEFDPATTALRPARQLRSRVYSWVWNLRYLSDGRLLTDGGKRVVGWEGDRDTLGFDLALNSQAGKAVEVRMGAVDPRLGRVVSLGMDGSVGVWSLPASGDPVTGPKMLGDKPHGPGKLCAAVRERDGRIATGGPDGTVRLWDRNGADLKVTLPHPSTIEAIEFQPGADARWLATACRDGGVRLWDVETGNWIGVGWHHGGPVTRVRFSPDGRRVLSASRDGTARLCNIPEPEAGNPVAILAWLEADAGIRIQERDGRQVGATFAPPQPLTRDEFLARRR